MTLNRKTLVKVYCTIHPKAHIIIILANNIMTINLECSFKFKDFVPFALC